MSEQNSTASNAMLKQLIKSANGIAVSNPPTMPPTTLPTNLPTSLPTNPSADLHAQPPPGWPVAGYVMQGPYGPAMQQQQEYQQQQHQHYAHQQQYQPYVHHPHEYQPQYHPHEYQPQYQPQYQPHPQQYLPPPGPLPVHQPSQSCRVPIQELDPKVENILNNVRKSGKSGKSAKPRKDPRPKKIGLSPRGGSNSHSKLNSAIREQMRLQQSKGVPVVVKVEQKTRKHLKRKPNRKGVDSFMEASLIRPSAAAVEAAEIMAKQGAFVLEVSGGHGVSYFDGALEISRKNKSATPPAVVETTAPSAAADPPVTLKYLQNKAGALGVTHSASSNEIGRHGRSNTPSSTGTSVYPVPDDTTATAMLIAQALVGLGRSNVVINQPPQNQDENHDYTNDDD